MLHIVQNLHPLQLW